jgi:hypothetical protein
MSSHLRPHAVSAAVVVAASVLSISGAKAAGSSGPYSNGGAIGAPQIVAQYNHSGEPFRIEGYCRSSCTMLLGIKSVCVDPNATLAFHAAILSPTQTPTPQANSRMLSFYNSKLRQYVTQNHFLDSWEFHTISGADIIQKFGYRQCP